VTHNADSYGCKAGRIPPCSKAPDISDILLMKTKLKVQNLYKQRFCNSNNIKNKNQYSYSLNKNRYVIN